MRRISLVIGVLVLLAGVLTSSQAMASEERSGVIRDEVWEEDEGPYEITGPLVINELTIEEGTMVVVQGDYPITVAGVLTVEGTAENPVTFTFKTKTDEGWRGIIFAESQNGSEIDGADISYARKGLTTNRRGWSIEQSYFHDNTVGVEISGAPVGDSPTGSFVTNYVNDNETGVSVTGRVAEFELNTVTENDKGILFSTTSGSYSSNNIFDNSDFDASTCDFVGTGTVDATENWWGTDDDDDIEDAICDGYDKEESHPVVDFDSFETAPVPDAAGDVSNPSPSPSPSTTSSPPPTSTSHGRTVTLSLRRHLRVGGTATVSDRYPPCSPTSVRIKFKPPGGTFRLIKTVPVDRSGAYAARIKDRPGLYRASLSQVSTTNHICLAAASPKVRHAHN